MLEKGKEAVLIIESQGVEYEETRDWHIYRKSGNWYIDLLVYTGYWGFESEMKITDLGDGIQEWSNDVHEYNSAANRDYISRMKVVVRRLD